MANRPIDPTWRHLAVAGVEVHAMHGRLTALIGARLGAEDAAFLGVPQIDPGGTISGWTGPSGAPLILAPELEGQAEVIRARVLGLADSLDTTGDAGQRAALSLRLAMVTPDGVRSVASDNGQPVLINWGAALPGQEVPAEAEASGLSIPVGHAMPAGTARRRGIPLATLWFVPLMLAAGLGYLAFLAAQPLPPRIVEIIPPAPSAPDPREGLPARLGILDTALTEARGSEPRFLAACVDPPVIEVPEPPAQVAIAPEPEPAPVKPPARAKPKPKPPRKAVAPNKPVKPKPEPKTQPKRARTLKDVITSRDIRGIEGCWRQASPHRSNGRDTGLTDARLCFDAAGNGSARYNLRRGGYRCTEPIRAYFRGNQIVLGSGGTQVCRGGGRTKRNKVRATNGYCEVRGNRSRCRVPSTGVTYQLVR